MGEQGGVDGRLGNGYAKEEEMKEVPVESVDWARCPTGRLSIDSWMDFQHKVPAEAY